MTYKLEDVTPRPWSAITLTTISSIFGAEPKLLVEREREEDVPSTDSDFEHIVHCVNNHETLLALVEELVDTLSSAREKTEDLLVGHSACHLSLVPWKLAELDNGIEKATETLNKIKGE